MRILTLSFIIGLCTIFVFSASNLRVREFAAYHADLTVFPGGAQNIFYSGEEVEFYIEIVNETGEDVPSTSLLKFKLVEEENYSKPGSFWNPKTPGLVYEETIPPIKRHDHHVIKIRQRLHKASVWYPRVFVDFNNEIDESNEADNDDYTKDPIIVKQRINDLAVRVFYKGGTPWAMKERAYITEVSNIGTTQSPPTRLKVTFVDSRAGTKWYDIPGLRPGAIFKYHPHYCFTVEYRHRYRIRGTKIIRAWIDPDNKTSDHNRNNNYYEFKFSVK